MSRLYLCVCVCVIPGRIAERIVMSQPRVTEISESSRLSRTKTRPGCSQADLRSLQGTAETLRLIKSPSNSVSNGGKFHLRMHNSLKERR